MPATADEDSGGAPVDGYAAVYVASVRLANFRGITECTIEFEPDLTVLVGRNNAGKSRIRNSPGSGTA